MNWVEWLSFLVIILYIIVSFVYIGSLYREEWRRRAPKAVRAALLLHTLYLGVRLLQTGRPPFLNFYDSAFFFTWVVMLNFALIEYLMELKMSGLFIVPLVSWLLVGTSVFRGDGPGEWPEFLSASWVNWHVLAAFLGYGAFTLSFVLGAMYLLQERQLRRKSFQPLFYLMPSLEALDRGSGIFVYIGWPLLTLALVVGSYGSLVVWGDVWAWDSKRVWSLIAWLIYGGYFFLRQRGLYGRNAAFLSIVGFLSIIFNFFVVSMGVSDWHRYNF